MRRRKNVQTIFKIALLFVIFFAASHFGLAVSSEDVLFYVSFDDGPDAIKAGGNGKAIVKGAPAFVAGKTGKGYENGDPNIELKYETKGNIDEDAGTVALWVKPEGWSIDSYMRFWFRVGEDPKAGGAGSGNFLWLYKFFQMSVYWLVQHDYQQREVFLVVPQTGDSGGIYPFDWKDGRWTHLAASWCGGKMRLYIDGHYCGTATAGTRKILRRFAEYFYIGGASQHGKADTVIDEFYIFNRPLTELEARQLAELGKKAFDEPPAPPTLEAGCDYLPSQDKLIVSISVVGRRPGDTEGLKAQISIQDTGTERRTNIPTQTVPLSSTDFLKEVGVKGLDAGNYRVVSTLLEGSRICDKVSAEFEKVERPEWLGNQLGITKEIPAPWTPIVREGSALECWGRRYEWEDSLFPTRIVSSGQELLARPISLVGKKGEKEIEPSSVNFKWTRVEADAAEFTADAKIGPVPLTVSGRFEYDGFLWTQLKLSAKPGRTIDGLYLEIPLKPESATLMLGSPSVSPLSGSTQEFKCPLKGQPFLWLGNEQAGLQWCTNNNRDWNNAHPSRALELMKKKSENVLRVNFIDTQTGLSRPLEFTVGLQATPVKPLDPRMHSWDASLNRIKPSAERPGWSFYCSQWNADGDMRDGRYGYQAPGSQWERFLQGVKANNGRPWIYWNMHMMWRGAPVYRAFRSEWGDIGAPPPLDPKEAPPLAAGHACHEAASFRDFAVWRTWKSFKDTPSMMADVPGVYIDTAQAGWDASRTHGCALMDASGTIHKKHTLLGTHKLQKRFYIMMKEELGGKLIANHQSGAMHMTQLAFSDMMVTGEHLTLAPGLMKDMNYHNVLSLDGMRAEYVGAPWGIPMVFLSETARSHGGNKAAMVKIYGAEGKLWSEHLAGLLLLHDVIPWSAYVHGEPFARLSVMKEEFGWDEKTAFSGYWENASFLKLEADKEEVVASLYRRPGKALFVIMNNSDADAAVTLTPDLSALGLKAVSEVKDAYAGVTAEASVLANPEEVLQGKPMRFEKVPSPGRDIRIPVKGGKIEFTIKARSFRALVAEQNSR